MTLIDRIAVHSPRAWHALNNTWLDVARVVLHDGSICRGPHDRPNVALTFDDGPDPRWTPSILDALAQTEAKATFFFIGEHVQREPELARQVLDRGHQVGTHLFSHRRGGTASVPAFEDEVERALQIHEDVLGRRPTAMRFPWADAGVVRRSHLVRYGLTAFYWSFSSLDSHRSASDVVRRCRARMGPGSIALLHDGRAAASTMGSAVRAATVEAMPRILELLRNRGLRAVTLDELFA